MKNGQICSKVLHQQNCGEKLWDRFSHPWIHFSITRCPTAWTLRCTSRWCILIRSFTDEKMGSVKKKMRKPQAGWTFSLQNLELNCKFKFFLFLHPFGQQQTNNHVAFPIKYKKINEFPSYGDSIKKSKEFHQMEIAKRLNAIIAQLLPFLSQEVIKMMLLYRDLIW